MNIVKIGGNVIDDERLLSDFLKRFAAVPEPKLLVHGGGKEGSRLCKSLGIEPKMIDGRRVTDADTLRVVTMVYAGGINKRIVAELQKLGVDAIGLSGADGCLIEAKKRDPKPIDFGYVGDVEPEGVNVELLQTLLHAGLVPVVCAITHDGHGNLLNTNADSVATVLAKALSKVMPVTLTFCFEMPGVCADVNNPATLINEIHANELAGLIESGVVSGGMIPKLTNAVEAVNCGVESVVITSYSTLGDTNQGTIISL